MISSENIEAFSAAAYVIAPGNPLSSASGVELQDNGVLKVSVDNRELTIDTRSGLLNYNGNTIPMQWSNSDAELRTFLNRADRTATFGNPSSASQLDVRHTGNSTFIRFGQTLDSGVLISRTATGLGIATFDEHKGLRSVEVELPKATTAPNYDNALTYAAL